MQRRIVILLAIICSYWLSKDLQAQSIGVYGGYALNDMVVDLASKEHQEYSLRKGFLLGVRYGYQISPKFHIVSGSALMQKNYLTRGKFNAFNYHRIHRNTYVQIPLGVQFEIAKLKKLRIFCSGGFYGAYWLRGRVEGIIPNAFDTSHDIDSGGDVFQYFNLANYDEKIAFNRTKDNRFELGMDIGVRLTYPILKSTFLDIAFAYNRALTDQQKDYMVRELTRKNSTWIASLGVNYRLKK